ncbi:hypothetical protein A3A21_03230 [Candidatus Jorgensenbacteria bacterium RIFCSPLOWO2_01_FULL_45_25b]|uniref:Uncharacterized protein n=1 Tax=Candidatus Jorgensenbacteria bacterium RIFCSPLOWO2_01_FULL_45_25b TaxID=1798471 RepID=A0A1F6BU99_9BACT|nr:MAG: hypothetical protein A3A21_03230 [Candidatus Jorgensenbacteria bacterium RIFCSPLOWO2_01_FULL_45_25b]
MKFPNLKNLTAQFHDFFDRDPSKREPNPKRDWIILFISFCVVLILAGILHLSLYFWFLALSSKEPTLEGQATTTLSALDVQKVLDRYKQKEILFGQLMSVRPNFRDPSR